MANEEVILRRGPSSNMPSSKVPGTIYITTDTGEMYVDDTLDNRVQIGSKPDYEQNDSTASDYIKNRPFYVDGSTVEPLYNKTELTFDIDEEAGISSCEIPGVRLSLVEGQTYTVNFDDVDYIVQSHILEAEEGTTIGLGNLHFISGEDFSDTGEPFILLYNEYSEDEYSLVIATNIVDSTTHTVAIQIRVEHIVKLDNKFLDLSEYVKTEDLSDYAKKTDLSRKMNSSNPTGSGSFSLNRRVGSRIGGFSFSEGSGTTASGDFSHAEGTDTTASGRSSHAEGSGTTASSQCSHAEGAGTTASSDFSHAEGYNTTASGSYSHAESYRTTASGSSSHAEGYRTTASGRIQHVQGKNNIDSSDYAHIIGNGQDDNKSNAHTVDWQGNAWYAGAVTSTGADYAEFFEWLDGNPNEEDRVGYLVALDGEKIKLAGSQDEILGIISANPAILGDNYECNWKGKYLVDEFERILYEKVEEFIDVPKLDEETGETTIEKKSLGFFDRPKINPDYDPEQGYTNRRDRSEWATVGMLGKLIVRDDGTSEVNGYVTVKENGIATASTEKTNIRVLSRVNDHIIKVLLK